MTEISLLQRQKSDEVKCDHVLPVPSNPATSIVVESTTGSMPTMGRQANRQPFVPCIDLPIDAYHILQKHV